MWKRRRSEEYLGQMTDPKVARIGDDDLNDNADNSTTEEACYVDRDVQNLPKPGSADDPTLPLDQPRQAQTNLFQTLGEMNCLSSNEGHDVKSNQDKMIKDNMRSVKQTSDEMNGENPHDLMINLDELEFKLHCKLSD